MAQLNNIYILFSQLACKWSKIIFVAIALLIYFFKWNDGKYKELTYNKLHYYVTEILIVKS